MKKAILHIGVHKTGTTTIQNWMWANRDLIRVKTGWTYPEEFAVQNAHHVIPWSVMSKFEKNPISRPHRCEIDGIKGRLRNHNNIVLSSEAFCTADEEDVRKIGWLFEEFETTVVIFARRQDRLIQSEYVQRVKQEVFPLCDPFPEFAMMWRRVLPALDFHGLFQKWKRHFGKVVIKDFDVCASEGLMRSFLGVIEAGHLAPGKEAADNVSLNYYYVSGLREANMMEAIVPGTRERMIKGLSNINFPLGKLSFFNGAEAHKFMDQFHEGNDRLVRDTSGEFTGFDRSYPYIMPHQFVETRGSKFIDWLYKTNRNQSAANK